MVARPGGRRRWFGRLSLLTDDDREKEPLPNVALVALVVLLVGLGLLVWATL